MEVIEINQDGGGAKSKREKGSKGQNMAKKREGRIRTGYGTRKDYVKQSQSDRKKNGKKNSKKASKKDIDEMMKQKKYYFIKDEEGNIVSKLIKKRLGRAVSKKAGSKKAVSKKAGSKKAVSKKAGSKK
jgi:hypothetical protein